MEVGVGRARQKARVEHREVWVGSGGTEGRRQREARGARAEMNAKLTCSDLFEKESLGAVELARVQPGE